MAEIRPEIPTFKLVLGKHPILQPQRARRRLASWHGSAYLPGSRAALHSSRARLAPRSLYFLFTLFLTRVCSR